MELITKTAEKQIIESIAKETLQAFKLLYDKSINSFFELIWEGGTYSVVKENHILHNSRAHLQIINKSEQSIFYRMYEDELEKQMLKSRGFMSYYGTISYIKDEFEKLGYKDAAKEFNEALNLFLKDKEKIIKYFLEEKQTSEFIKDIHSVLDIKKELDGRTYSNKKELTLRLSRNEEISEYSETADGLKFLEAKVQAGSILDSLHELKTLVEVTNSILKRNLTKFENAKNALCKETAKPKAALEAKLIEIQQKGIVNETIECLSKSGYLKLLKAIEQKSSGMGDFGIKDIKEVLKDITGKVKEKLRKEDIEKYPLLYDEKGKLIS